MMNIRWMRSAAVAAVVVAVSASSSFAGVIVSGAADPLSPGLGIVTIPLILTSSPGNDNTADANSNNNITIATKAFEHNDYIDIVFTVTPTAPFSTPGSITEYRVVETVDNATGLPWSSYNMQLGFGTGAGFVPSLAGDSLDFDAPPDNDPPPTSGIMPTVVRPTEDSLLYTGGIHGAIQHTYEFHIDVPNLAGDSTYQFTLRQAPVPVVPEPGTIALLGLALCGTAACRKSR
jgi:hypothetical protein